MNQIHIFSPATVANVSCGFDVLGFCLDTIGDEMIIRKTPQKGICISKIEGYDLPFETENNVAGVSALALYNDANPDFGFEIEIYKKIKPGSGIGSSSASAAGSVFAMNELLGKPYNKTQLTNFAMKGEALASKCEHADNLAPALFGGFTLVKSLAPLQVLQLPTPKDLYAVVIHPQIEIKTSESRAILPQEIPLKNAITQWSNVGSFVHALHTEDYNLLSDSLNDVIAEPYRCQLIPYFDDVKQRALKHGALGSGISGSGPSIFSLCKGLDSAEKVKTAIQNVYSQTSIDFEIHLSKINTEGIKIL
ncbi:homoserine kinase [Psychroserpens ponticola]|uniref:Homoserine kinase n=1 Tax=Psychroserpens ponticola TaxID=2932268 RepID=A0ABY7RTF4_9FLAO|nr:homoserine kinase [Psychroserpens ponticola]WCO00389.1 homoserine kinase [Psychroserpens ponticola]